MIKEIIRQFDMCISACLGWEYIRMDDYDIVDSNEYI